MMDTVKMVHWINSLIQHHNIKAFYNSALWENARQEILDEQHHECQICKSRGLYSEAVTVHHIKFLRKHPELAITRSNLIAVCKDCHYDIHHRVETKQQLNRERW